MCQCPSLYRTRMELAYTRVGIQNPYSHMADGPLANCLGRCHSTIAVPLKPQRHKNGHLLKVNNSGQSQAHADMLCVRMSNLTVCSSPRREVLVVLRSSAVSRQKGQHSIHPHKSSTHHALQPRQHEFCRGTAVRAFIGPVRCHTAGQSGRAQPPTPCHGTCACRCAAVHGRTGSRTASDMW